MVKLFTTFLLLTLMFTLYSHTYVIGDDKAVEIIILDDPYYTPSQKYSDEFFSEMEKIEGNQLNVTVQLGVTDWNIEKKRFSNNSEVFDKNGNLKIYSSETKTKKNYKIYKSELARINNQAYKDFKKDITFKFDLIHQNEKTPFIVINLNKTDITKLINSTNVVFVKHTPVSHEEQEGDIFCEIEAICGGSGVGSTYNTEDNPIPLNTVNMDYAHNTGYTGEDIKIGIIDLGYVRVNSAILGYGRVIYDSNYDFENPDYDDHSSYMALISSSIEGVAPESIIYSAKRTSDDLSSQFDWFIENDVHIVTISNAVGGVCSTTYDNTTTQYTDYISRAYFINIVKSSGNNSCSSQPHMITRPGLGSNVITVGGVDEDGTDVEDLSNFVSNSTTDIDKPNLVAPVGEYSFNEFNSSYYAMGTSFSAPVVSGAIALLFDKDPSLKYKPHMVSALLMASANSDLDNRGDLRPSGLYDKAGAGLLDIERLMSSTQVQEWTYSGSSATLNFTLTGSSYFKVSTTWLRNQHYNTNVDDSQFEVTIKNQYGIIVDSKTVSYGNVLMQEIPHNSNYLTESYTITITPISINQGNYIYNEYTPDSSNIIYGATAIYTD